MARKRAATPQSTPLLLDEKASVFFFRVRPEAGTAADIERLLVAFHQRVAAGELRLLDFDHRGRPHQFLEPRWEHGDGLRVFSATVLKQRDDPNPPAGQKGELPAHLRLPRGKWLSETMCFAYEPAECVAAVFHTVKGPTHTILPVILEELGFPHRVKVTNVCWDDVMERLAGMGVVRAVTMGFKNLSEADILKEAGASVEHALELGMSLSGRTLFFRVTVREDRQESELPVVARTVRKLKELGLDRFSHLRLEASATAEAGPQVLDFIKARIETKIPVIRAGDSMDRDACHRHLIRSLKEALPDLRNQRRT